MACYFIKKQYTTKFVYFFLAKPELLRQHLKQARIRKIQLLLLFDFIESLLINFAEVDIVELVLWSELHFYLWHFSIERDHYANLHELLVTLGFGVAHLKPHLQRKARLEEGNLIATLKDGIEIGNPRILGLVTAFVALHLNILSRRLDKDNPSWKLISIKIMIGFFIRSPRCSARSIVVNLKP